MRLYTSNKATNGTQSGEEQANNLKHRGQRKIVLSLDEFKLKKHLKCVIKTINRVTDQVKIN